VSAPAAVLDARCADLLQQALEWRLIARLFELPRGAWLEEIRALGERCSDSELQHAVAAAARAGEGEYLGLLGPGGPLSPREAGHRRTGDPAQTLASIRAFHAAFAFEPQCADPVDHVAVEAGFVGWLRLKQAYAVANGDEEAASVTADAAQRFLREHLALCAEPLARALEEATDGHLVHAARALLARTGPRPRNAEGDWVPAGLGVEACALACGLGEGGGAQAGDLPPEFTAGLPPDALDGPPRA
jgi:TorA maturation chaperone TorD